MGNLDNEAFRKLLNESTAAGHGVKGQKKPQKKKKAPRPARKSGEQDDDAPKYRYMFLECCLFV